MEPRRPSELGLPALLAVSEPQQRIRREQIFRYVVHRLEQYPLSASSLHLTPTQAMSDGRRFPRFADDVKLERGEDADTTAFLPRKDSSESLDELKSRRPPLSQGHWVRAVTLGVVLGLGLALLVAFVSAKLSCIGLADTNNPGPDPWRRKIGATFGLS